MLDELKRELQKIHRSALRRVLPPARIIGGAVVEISGKQCVDFTNWDLLSIGSQANVKRAAHSAIERGSLGVSSARTASGTSAELIAIESRLAKFLGAEAAMIFPSKNQAIFTIFTNLLGERDTVIAEDVTQSPVGDAAYLVNSPLVTFRNGDMNALAQELEKARAARRRFCVIEGISPVTGAPGNVAAAAALCAKHDTQLIIDESFSIAITGVCGGGAHEQSVLTSPLFTLGDLGFTFGLFGGFVAGPQIAISYLTQRSRSLGTDIPLPSQFASATDAAIDFVERAHLAREDLNKRAGLLHSALVGARVPLASTLTTPVVSIPISKLSLARQLQNALLERGVLIQIITPSAPLSEVCYARLLVSLRHTEKQLELASHAIIELLPRINSLK